MYSKKLNNFIYMIDLKPAGIKNLISSYVLKASKVVIIESGPLTSVENLLAGLKEIGIKNERVDYLAVSHVHVDHAGGAGALLGYLPNAKLLVHPRGAPHLVNPEKLWMQSKQVLGKVAEMYGEVQSVPKERIITVTDEMIINLGESVELKVLDSPGHASHELSFYENTARGIFTGDTAGIYLSKFDVVMPTSPPPFHLEKAFTSISRLVEMAPERLYYSHFGPADDAVRKLKAYAGQLKLWGEIIFDGMKDGEKFATIYERILERDASMKQIADYVNNHVVLREFKTHDIQGFIEYFKKYFFETHSNSKIRI